MRLTPLSQLRLPLIINGAIAVAGVTAGCLWAMAGEVPLVPPPPRPASWHDFATIIDGNEAALFSMLWGLPIAGIYGNALVFGNCFRFGFMCTAVFIAAPFQLAFLLIHGPLELAAFALGSASVQGASIALLRNLLGAEPQPWQPWLPLFAAAGGALVFIAGLEMLGIHLREFVH